MFYSNDRADEAVQEILVAFQHPDRLPKPIATIFLHRHDAVPCRNWSWRNQLLVALNGHTDARGYCAWKKVGRTVRHKEKAFYIFSPLTTKKTDEQTGEEKQVAYAWKGTPVFGLEQTDGDPLPNNDDTNQRWIESLPLVAVARAWNLNVEIFDGEGSWYLGAFQPRHGITLGVKNLSTWTHELVHAADHHNGKLKELGQHWQSETVAELGGAALLNILGLEHDADLGGCWNYIEHYAKQEHKQVVEVCGLVLERTCEAIATILATATEIQQATSTVEAGT